MYDIDEIWDMFEIDTQTWPPNDPKDYHMDGPDNKYTCKKCGKIFVIRPESAMNNDAEFAVLSYHAESQHGEFAGLIQEIEALEERVKEKQAKLGRLNWKWPSMTGPRLLAMGTISRPAEDAADSDEIWAKEYE